MAAGGYVIYGPQNNLQLIFITLLGGLMSTLVCMSIVLAAGSVSKSSMLAALLGIGVWFGLTIASGIISAFSSQAGVATYFPGSGASGTLSTPPGESVSTGTDNIATNLITYLLHSAANVGFYRIELTGTPPLGFNRVLMYTEPLSLVAARSIIVAAVYIIVFNLIAWYTLKRTQITE